MYRSAKADKKGEFLIVDGFETSVCANALVLSLF